MRLLIVEDSEILRSSLAQGLREVGYAVDAVGDGKRAIQFAATSAYDVVVLDWMLPEADGLAVLRELRRRKLDVAIIMLTAKDTLDDKLVGLGHGADDYLVKPFAFAELLARIRTLARRRLAGRAQLITIGPLSIDTEKRQAFVSPPGPAPGSAATATTLDLAPREYAILECLALHLGSPVSRDQIEDCIYDDRSQVTSNSVDSAIGVLRAKLRQAGCPPLIHTRRKVGYCLSETQQ